MWIPAKTWWQHGKNRTFRFIWVLFQLNIKENLIQEEEEDQQVDPSSKMEVVGEEEEETKTYEISGVIRKSGYSPKEPNHFITMEA